MGRRKQRAKDNLIPYEKSRRIIRLDRRGAQSRKGLIPAVLIGLLGLCCILYCLTILFFMGYGTKFFLIWGAIGVVLTGLSFLLFRPKLRLRIPKWIRVGFGICAVIGTVLLIVVEGLVLSEFGATPTPGADYVIVLGAQWKAGGPSYTLEKRLEAALGYLRDNPDTRVIVSGGQGPNEPMSEAAGMAGWLETAGIDPERIIRESASTDTNENLRFSGELLDRSQDRVVIVTNNFHVYRALGIARKQGFTQVEGLAARTYPAMVPNNLLREFFGVMKDFLAGNM
ncbi:MAG: YdcF family protein [Clostridium sp.]|nr:YdcF family protein [Acetatifactor muris]MCM1525785.1 YdcF family protein [Bacteroides sp.]MCM1564041.1 YdcF family protein [Clostridium sp.]